MAGDEKKMHHVNDDPDVQALPGAESSVDDEKRVRRKIDCVILPMVRRTLGDLGLRVLTDCIDVHRVFPAMYGRLVPSWTLLTAQQISIN